MTLLSIRFDCHDNERHGLDRGLGGWHPGSAGEGALPAPITTAERGTGRKTHGRWVGADGQVRSINSGKDGISRGALAWLLTQVHRPVSSSTHAEMKLAYYLRQMHERSGQPQHATIVVNNLVCKGPHSCATLLPVMLPAGCTLTVHAPNYRRTFTGGARP